MPKRLLIAAGEAADSADALPFGVRELIDTSDEVLVVTPTLPTRFEWLASATDKAREQADERLQAVLGQIEELGTEAGGTVGADDPLLAFEDALAAFHADHILVGSSAAPRPRSSPPARLCAPPSAPVALDAIADGVEVSSRLL